MKDYITPRFLVNKRRSLWYTLFEVVDFLDDAGLLFGVFPSNGIKQGAAAFDGRRLPPIAKSGTNTRYEWLFIGFFGSIKTRNSFTRRPSCYSLVSFAKHV
jgi:hypothetical protein